MGAAEGPSPAVLLKGFAWRTLAPETRVTTNPKLPLSHMLVPAKMPFRYISTYAVSFEQVPCIVTSLVVTCWLSVGEVMMGGWEGKCAGTVAVTVKESALTRGDMMRES